MFFFFRLYVLIKLHLHLPLLCLVNLYHVLQVVGNFKEDSVQL